MRSPSEWRGIVMQTAFRPPLDGKHEVEWGNYLEKWIRAIQEDAVHSTVAAGMALLEPTAPKAPPLKPAERREVPDTAERMQRDPKNRCENCHDEGIPNVVKARVPGRVRRRTKCRFCERLLCTGCYWKTKCPTSGDHHEKTDKKQS